MERVAWFIIITIKNSNLYVILWQEINLECAKFFAIARDFNFSLAPRFWDIDMPSSLIKNDIPFLIT